MWQIILALLLWVSPQSRNLPIQPEPPPLPIPSPIVVADVYLPMVYGVTPVTANENPVAVTGLFV